VDSKLVIAPYLASKAADRNWEATPPKGIPAAELRKNPRNNDEF
jgi:hypothetical protein